MTEVEVLNLALGYLGAGSITSTSENSKQARALSTYKDGALDEVLRRIAPPPAIKRAALVASTTTNLTDYDYLYTVPSDCIRILNLLDADNYAYLTDSFDVEGGIIYCDLDSAAIRYVYRNTNFDDYDQTFMKAYALYMASEVAPTLIPGGLKYQQQYLALYEARVIEVKGQEVRETPKAEGFTEQYHEWW